VSYDVAYDGVAAVGHALASTLVDRLKRLHQKHGANIVMLDGDLTDPNAVLFKATAHEVFDPLVSRGALTIAAEYETPWWQPEAAQAEMEEALQLGIRVDGVYAANDGLASGAIAAMKAAGIVRLPPVTGQDAELSAIQRFLVGEQYMTYTGRANPWPKLRPSWPSTWRQGRGHPSPPPVTRSTTV
jgi:D-xylose transport system substrate-binding protein